MPVIAVINRKGGSGKSTLATHLAAWLAHQRIAVMLGDVDRQQSTRSWLKLRSESLPAIVPWALEQKNILKVPAGVTHVVLDTPGGIQGFELAKVIMSADAVLMPVCNSLFDRESAQACHAELLTLPRVASGRCKLGLVGMRIDARTRAGDSLKLWAQALGIPFIGVLREAQLYVKSLESGETLFDMRASANAMDLHQWQPIFDWLGPLTNATAIAKAKPTSVTTPSQQSTPIDRQISAAGAASLMPAQKALVHGDRLSVIASARPMPSPMHHPHEMTLAHGSRGLPDYTGPQFLLRQ